MEASSQKPIALVTGGTSGIGRAVISRLLSEGYDVRVLLRGNPNTYQDWKALPPGCRPYVADITLKSRDDEKNLEAACMGVSVVFHIAGATFNSKFSYNQLIETNVIGTENLLKSIADTNKGASSPVHFLFTSTTTVYGYRRRGETLTEMSDEAPSSRYAESKLMAEHLIESFAESHSELFYTIFRIGTIYGPGYEKPHFFKAFRLVQEQKMKYIGRGTNHLPLVSADDVADAMLLAAHKPKASANQIFNLTDGVAHTPRELFGIVAKVLGVAPPSKSVNPALARLLARAADIDYDEYEFLAGDRIVSIAKITNRLGWAPSRRIDIDGLLMVEDYIRSTKRATVRA